MKNNFFGQTLCVVFSVALLLFSRAGFTENIDPENDGSQYTWGENVGWINLEPGGDGGAGVEVADAALTGYMWGENIGWINLNPSYGGVFNNGCGYLSGSAWTENAGWINFAPSGGGVSIDPETGLFSGHAWGENIGWINFAPTVAGVKTSWGFEVVGDAGLSAISETKLTANDAAGGDTFGHSVAFSGDVAVAGSPLDDDKGSSSGSAYVFRYNTVTTGWDQEAKLTASDGADGDNLGRSVAISGDKVVVGAVLDDSGAPNAGSAYVFRYEPIFARPAWIQEAELTANDAATDDRFGSSVAISGDVAVVAAPFDDSFKGSVYVFRYNDVTGWGQEAKLVGADSVAGDRFGYSVAISGNRIVVGAVLAYDGAPYAGSVYVFRYDTTIGWFQEAKLTASDAAAGNNFGHSVAINGTTVAIGAPFAQGSGSVYVFRYELAFGGFRWVQKGKLTASDSSAGQLFGTPIVINGETIVAGAHADGHVGSYSGSAYVFGYSKVVWTEKAKLTASDAAADDWFGWSVAMSGDRVVVGALYDDDAGASSGSLYVFDLAAETPEGNCVSTTPIEPRTGRSPVTVTFSQVLEQGTTSVTTSTSSSTPPPAGHEEIEPPLYLDVITTAETSGPITVIVSYEGSTFNNESELGLFHEEVGQWVEVTTSQDTVENTVTGLTGRLSSFAIFERTSATTANIVIDGCDTGVLDQIYDGKLISAWIGDCATGAKNHGQFVSCIAHLTNDLKKFGLITDSEKGSIQSCAAQADIP